MSVPKRISYSRLVDWMNCPYYYYLKNIEKLYPFENTVLTYDGTLLHDLTQKQLKEEINLDFSLNYYSRFWRRFFGIYGRYVDCEKFSLENIQLGGSNIIKSFVPAIRKSFGNFEVFAVEEELYSKVENFSQIFKGFVDLVLRDGDKIYILDMKTCGSAFFFRKYQDKYKDYQLTLYKHFWQKAHPEFDLKNIETYFVLMERNHKSKNPIQIDRITSGNKKIDNAIKWMETGLKNINKENWIKKKTHCFAYGRECPFRQSHCLSKNKT